MGSEQSKMIRPNANRGFHLTELAWFLVFAALFGTLIGFNAVVYHYGVDMEAVTGTIGSTMAPDNLVFDMEAAQ